MVPQFSHHSAVRLIPPLKDLLVILLLGIFVTLCYSQALSHSFVWDTEHFFKHPQLHALNWDNTVWIFSNSILSNWHPVSWLSHTLDFVLFGWSPAGHHLTNLIIHFLNGVLVFWLVKELVSLSHQSYSNQAFLIAGLSALLFTIHPLRVEVVAWVAARKDLLYSFFTLLSILTYVRYAGSGNAQYRSLTYILSLIFFTLALLSKSMAVTLPAVLVVLDIYPLARAQLTLRNLPRTIASILWDKIPYLLLTIAIIIVTLVAQSDARSEHFNFIQQLQNATHNVGFYLLKFFAPVNLSPFYPFESIDSMSATSYWLLSATAIGIISVGVIYLSWRGYALPLCCWVLYLITLSPASGIIHVGAAASADRYTYLTLLPLTVLLAIVTVNVYLKFARYRSITLALSLFCILSLALLAHAQTTVWTSPISLWTRVLQLYPDAGLAHRNISSAYAVMGEYDLAILHLEKISRQGWDVDVEMAEALSLANRTDEAVSLYKKMLKSDQFTESDKSLFLQEIQRMQDGDMPDRERKLR